MKRILLASLLLLPSAAVADPSFTITDMSCARVQAAVKANVSAILHYRSKRNPSLPLYSRYVADARGCSSGQNVTTTTVPAADNKACVVRNAWRI